MTLKASIKSINIKLVDQDYVGFTNSGSYTIHFNLKGHMVIYSRSQEMWHYYAKFII